MSSKPKWTEVVSGRVNHNHATCCAYFQVRYVTLDVLRQIGEAYGTEDVSVDLTTHTVLAENCTRWVNPW